MKRNPLSALQEQRRILRDLVIYSWLAIGCWLGFVALLGVAWFRHGGISGVPAIVAGFLLLAAMVLAMNQMARTDIALWNHPDWWTDGRFVRWLHAMTDEGELAGIAVGIVSVGLWQALSGHPILAEHIPYGMGFTLLGIMSGAALVQQDVVPLVSRLERLFERAFKRGRWLILVVGGASSSVIGEPGGAYVAGNYIVDRVPPERGTQRSLVGAGLAAAIGSGGALLWFAAPPILIVHGKLAAEGWTLLTLQLLVGVPALTQVMLVASRISQHIQPVDLDAPEERPIRWRPLIGFAALALAHIITPAALMPIVYSVDIVVGAVNVMDRWTETTSEGHKISQHDFAAIFQPALLALLLIVFEMVAHIGHPSLEWLGSQLTLLGRTDSLTFVLLLFVFTSVVGTFADNALASAVMVTIPLGVMEGPAQHLGIAAVLMAALYGGITLPPSNLPNFAIFRIFRMQDTWEWLAGSLRILPTGLIYLVWIPAQWYAWQAGWLDWLIPS